MFYFSPGDLTSIPKLKKNKKTTTKNVKPPTNSNCRTACPPCVRTAASVNSWLQCPHTLSTENNCQQEVNKQSFKDFADVCDCA